MLGYHQIDLVQGHLSDVGTHISYGTEAAEVLESSLGEILAILPPGKRPHFQDMLKELNELLEKLASLSRTIAQSLDDVEQMESSAE